MNIVAEIGTSHGGSIEKAYSLIDACQDSGADSVKFQWVYAEEILHENTGFVKLPGGNIRLFDRFKELETDISFYEKCRNYSLKKGMKFICSPFGLKSLKELLTLSPDAIKIASPEVNHIPLLQETAKEYGKTPIIISSGVSKLGDIEKAISILQGTSGVNPSEKSKNHIPYLTLLHCITSYPAPEKEYNVKTVKTLGEITGLETGISDHSLSPVLVPVLTTLMGGSMIEKHITLSNETDGLDDPVALTQENFALMVHCVHQTETLINRCKKEELGRNNGELPQFPSYLNKAFELTLQQLKEEFSVELINEALGTGIKKLAKSEEANYGRTNRSLHYLREMKKGETVTEKDIGVLRTEKILTPGIGPEWLETIKGKKLCQDVTNGEGITFSHFMSE